MSDKRPNALDRLLDALADPARGDRTALGLLIGYCLVWTFYGVIAKGSQDVHFDMGEMVAWSREISLGTPKHPPLSVWAVAAWFKLFPLADWSYYLFAMIVPTLALWIAWVMAGRYLPPEKRALSLALLTLVPFYNFHALKFNANTIMLPLWAATTWAFLRSYDTRRADYAALAGLAAAAMLGKYWSIVLLIGLGLAALADPRRKDYFRSAAPWVTVAVGAAALSPHVAWLYAHDFLPFKYALESHPGTVLSSLLSGLGYVAGALGMIAAPIGLTLLAAKPDLAALFDTLWPREADRRLVLLAFILPLLLPTLAAVATREEVVSLWAFGGMSLAPIVLLGSNLVSVPRVAARRVLAIALAVPFIALAASPLVAFVIHRQGVPNFGTHYRLVAQALDKAWRATTDQPLRLVGSSNNLLHGMLIYLPGTPSTYEVASPYLTPWTDTARIARDGIAIACPVSDIGCVRAMDALAARGPAGQRSEVEIARTYFGVTGKPERYVIATVPPATNK